MRRRSQDEVESMRQQSSLIHNGDCRTMIEFTKRFLYIAAHTCILSIPNAGKKHQNAVEPNITFRRCLERRKIAKLTKILSNERYNLRLWLPNCIAGKEPSSLHLLLEHNPTVDLVGTLIDRMKQINPEISPEIQQDQKGMTPLHVAIVNFCDAGIIEKLIFGNCASMNAKSSAAIEDCHRRFPLHYICSNRTRLQQNVFGKRKNLTFEDTIRIIRWLVVSFPDAIDAPDENGWTPRAMADRLDADERVLELLNSSLVNKQRSLMREKISKKSDSSALTPSTSNSTNKSNLPFAEIYCYDLSDDDYDDDISSIGWNMARSTAKMNSKATATMNHITLTSFENTDNSVCVVGTRRDQLNRKVSHKFRFL